MVEHVLIYVQEICLLLIALLILARLFTRIVPGEVLFGLILLMLLSFLAGPAGLSRLLQFVVPRVSPLLLALIVLLGLRVMVCGWRGRRRG